MNNINNKVTLKWFLALLLCIVLVLNFSKTLDQQAQAPLDMAFERALITYGVAKSINAVISVIQGTELAIEPAGVGVILKPGEILDPINDLIERFSWIVLAATTSLGMQKILLGIGAAIYVQAVVCIAILVLLFCLWQPGTIHPRLRAMLIRVSVALLFFRFLIPGTILINSMVYDAFLDERYMESYTMLEEAEQNVQALQEAENDSLSTAENEGIFDSIGRWYDRTTNSINLQARIDSYQARLGNASDQIIDLTTVFILQTIVFPLLLLWLGMLLARTMISGKLWEMR